MGAVLNVVDVSDESIGIQIIGATADLFNTLNNTDAKDPGDGMFLLKWYTDTMGQTERYLSGPEKSKVLYFWLYATLQKNPNVPPGPQGGNPASPGVGQVLPPTSTGMTW